MTLGWKGETRGAQVGSSAVLALTAFLPPRPELCLARGPVTWGQPGAQTRPPVHVLWDVCPQARSQRATP